MQNINVRRPMEYGDLAQMFRGGSPTVSSQAGGYLQDQANRMGVGVGGVGNYFAGQRMMDYNTAAAMQGRQMEQARLASPQVDPQQIAALQFQQRLAANPLPMAGMAQQPGSTFDDQQRFEQGFSRDQWAVQKRLGPGLSRMLSMGGRDGMLPEGTRPQAFNRNVTADDLMQDKNFRGLMQSRPEMARQAFQAILGSDYDEHIKGQQAVKAAQSEDNTKALRKRLEAGTARSTKNGMEFAETAYDPMTRDFKPTGKWGQGSAFERILAGEQGNVSQSMNEFARLHAIDPGTEPTAGPAAFNPSPFAALQNYSPAARPPAGVLQSEAFARMRQRNPQQAAAYLAAMQESHPAASNIFGPQNSAPFNLFNRY